WPTARPEDAGAGRHRLAAPLRAARAGTAGGRERGRRGARGGAGPRRRGGRLRGVRGGGAAGDAAARRRPGGTAQAVAAGPEGSAPAPGGRAARRTLASAAALVLVLGDVRAELAQRLARQLQVLLGEVLAFPAHQGVVLEVQRQGLDLHVALAVGALAGGVVPALVVEGIGQRGGAEQAGDLLLAQARAQLVHRLLFHQVALVDRLLVQDAATGEGQAGGSDQQQAGQAWHCVYAGMENGPMIHSRRAERPVAGPPAVNR